MDSFFMPAADDDAGAAKAPSGSEMATAPAAAAARALVQQETKRVSIAMSRKGGRKEGVCGDDAREASEANAADSAAVTGPLVRGARGRGWGGAAPRTSPGRLVSCRVTPGDATKTPRAV